MLFTKETGKNSNNIFNKRFRERKNIISKMGE